MHGEHLALKLLYIHKTIIVNGWDLKTIIDNNPEPVLKYKILTEIVIYDIILVNVRRCCYVGDWR